MQIIAHRGFWQSPEEKNTDIAFKRAIELDFGIETDLRDLNGKLVISHDSPTGGELSFENFMERFGARTKNLAVNIKSDGLSKKFELALADYDSHGIVFFDMSGPEHFLYRKAGLRTLNRVSEFEKGFEFEIPDYGTWLDGFESDEWRIRWLEHNQTTPNIYIVSPELHGRDHLEFWESIRGLEGFHNFLLCTDFPVEARHFFGADRD